MSNKIPEETLKQWNEEFCKINKVNSETVRCSFTLSPALDGFIQAKTFSYERELKKEIEIRDLLKSIELSHLHSEDEESFEKILAIENLLSNDSKDKRYKFMDEMEKLQEQLSISQVAYDDLWDKCSSDIYWIRENRKLQERIKELEAIRVITYSECNEKLNKAHSQIEKRDELLVQAKEIIESRLDRINLMPEKSHDRLMLSSLVKTLEQWLKQYEELKR